MTSVGLVGVSRETNARLTIYADLLRKWNASINLVSKATLDELWRRHMADSAQLSDLAPNHVDHWVDFGSGGGFPGLVIAILAMEAETPKLVTLIESDSRKSAFLRTVIRETGANAKVITDRVERIAPLQADLVSARALADLSTLLGFVEHHMMDTGVALFPKGESWEKELEIAQSKWRFDYQFVKSKTETGPGILRISGVSRV